MAFFGFTQPTDLEEERRKFIEGALNGGGQQEDVAVYTWGEEGYDGLGDALQERGDELNDETFGGGTVGKDFDFTGAALPDDGRTHQAPRESTSQVIQQGHPAQPYLAEEIHQSQTQAASSSRHAHSLESIWDDKSPFSVLPRANGSHRTGEHRATPSQSYSTYGNQTHETHVAQPSAQPLNLGGAHSQGVRTLEEIEAEMRQAAFAAQRNQNISPSQHHVQARPNQGRGTPQLQQQQQRYLQQDVATPPRLHPHAQSPRFHQYHQEQQIQLLEQERLRQIEDLRQQERLQLIAQMERERQRERQREREQLLREAQQARYLEIQQQRQLDRRQAQAQAAAAAGRMTPPVAAELQQRRYGHHSPANNYPAQRQEQQVVDAPFQQSMQYLPRDIQMQQRLLAEMAQAEFQRLNILQASAAAIAGGGNNHPLYTTGDIDEEREHQETLRAEAMRKIMEAERMEEKRRRKLEKIRHMSRYNDLMTQSDKDFITRIQVSQLVTQDPFTEDWYAQVYSAHTRLRAGVSGPDTVLKIGNAGGVGLGLSQNKGGARRPSAMQRMEAQVERIVNNARLREKEKTSLNNLQGALGKTAGRSYKAAPRQLLQVDANAASPSPTLSHATAHAHISKADAAARDEDTKEVPNAAAESARIGKQALTTTGSAPQVQEPLNPREALVKLERIYDMVLELEQLKNDPPAPEDIEGVTAWDAQVDELIENIWNSLGVLVPINSGPHPFITLITPMKGKRLLSRVMRYFSHERVMQTIALLVSKFSQLDVVVNADLLDTLQDSPDRREALQQTQAFELSVIQSVFPASASANLRAIRGLLGIFLHDNDISIIARTKPGIALLTLFLSRAEVIKQNIPHATDASELPPQADLDGWKPTFDQFFDALVPHLPYIFPSVRQAINTGGMPVTEVPDMDVIDHDVWAFLATLSVASNTEQQQILVTSLRERVLENVASATKGWSIPNEEVRKMRLANVNLFLHALGLDSSQIAL